MTDERDRDTDPAPPESVELPKDPPLPDFDAIRADPSLTPSERLQIVIFEQIVRLNDTLLGPDGSLEQLRTEVREKQTAQQQKLDQLLIIVTRLVDAHAAHEQRDQESFEDNRKRLDRHRSELNDTSYSTKRIVERLDELNEQAHLHASKLQAHATKIHLFEQRLSDLEDRESDDGK